MNLSEKYSVAVNTELGTLIFRGGEVFHVPPTDSLDNPCFRLDMIGHPEGGVPQSWGTLTDASKRSAIQGLLDLVGCVG